MAYGDSAGQSSKTLANAFGDGDGYDESWGLSEGAPNLGNAFSDSLGVSSQQYLMILTQEAMKLAFTETESSIGVVAAQLAQFSQTTGADEKQKSEARSTYLYALMAQQNLKALADMIEGLQADINAADRAIERIRSGVFDSESNEEDKEFLDKLLEETGMSVEEWEALSDEEKIEAVEAYRDGLVEQKNEMQQALDLLKAAHEELSSNSYAVIDLGITNGAFNNPVLEEAAQRIESMERAREGGDPDYTFDRSNLTLASLDALGIQVASFKSDTSMEIVAVDSEPEIEVSEHTEVGQDLMAGLIITPDV